MNHARRAFLGGRRDTGAYLPRMPWAVEGFTTVCQRCSDCVEACQERILVTGDGGYPKVDFARAGCTFCGACAAACGYGALDPGLAHPWSLKARVGESCLSMRGITCRACGDACTERALRFQLQTGGRAVPVVNESICNGCGSCIATCPIQVIQLEEAA
ncbi:MAG: ferredoxin-type protein NapF [Gammaproteobacteria bacterium]|nr:ferredoxin-type protein NapF [Gammaproteobacteria bacterium]MCP5318157.1 ferredoxin-type protein NapF [Chromatiaceae bacterium]MCP5431510.1 ferredoxin-type protein NapF [Chromatiaceae bacterium]